MSLCEVCSNLDFAAISSTGTTDQLTPRHDDPQDLNLFHYYVRESQFAYVDNGSKLYHKSLESLQSSAHKCDLCRVVKTSVDMVLGDMAQANDRGFEFPLGKYELWITDNIGGLDGFQILGLMTQDMKPKSKTYRSWQVLATASKQVC